MCRDREGREASEGLGRGCGWQLEAEQRPHQVHTIIRVNYEPLFCRGSNTSKLKTVWSIYSDTGVVVWQFLLLCQGREAKC